MQPDGEQGETTQSRLTGESDLTLEVVVLLILGVFTLLFGLLLFWIHTGALPYAPDSTYGLFLVLVSFQAITMGKTPFGDLRRSWLLVVVGIATAVLGMIACFIPGFLAGPVRIIVGAILTAGGIALLVQLYAARDRARAWLKVRGVLTHLTLACSIVYVLSVALGLVTLLPGITTDPQTAVLLVVYGLGFFYLAWCIQAIVRRYPPQATKDGGGA